MIKEGPSLLLVGHKPLLFEDSKHGLHRCSVTVCTEASSNSQISFMIRSSPSVKVCDFLCAIQLKPKYLGLVAFVMGSCDLPMTDAMAVMGMHKF